MTGELKELLTQLKIKDNADHVGHSLQSLRLRVVILFDQEIFRVFLNNNLLIVTQFVMVAMEDGQMLLCFMLKLTLLKRKQNIHMPQWMKHAKPKKVK